MRNEFSPKIQKVRNFESLVDFLRDSLNWPIPDEGLEFEEITYDWSAEDLRLDANTEARIISCRQLQLYDLKFDLSAVTRKPNANIQTYQQLRLLDLDSLENEQYWGIFFIEFADDVELDACKTLLRRVLRGLVDGPNHNALLPFWDYDKLLFICTTTSFQDIGFACCSGGKAVPLSMIIFYWTISDWIHKEIECLT